MNRRHLVFLAGILGVTAATHSVSPATAVVVAPAPAEDAATLVTKGRRALDGDDFRAAADAFLAAVKADAKNVEARRGAAEALLGLGRTDEALEHAGVGLDLAEEDGGLWLLFARGYLQRADTLPATMPEEIANNYADAEHKAGLALKYDDSLVLARVVLAKAHRMQKEYDEAEAVIKAALEVAPEDFDVLYEGGQLHIFKREFNAAQVLLARATEADPESGDAFYWLGYSLAFQGSWDGAYEAFKEAAIRNPADRRPLDYLAKYARDASTDWYRRIIEGRPDHAWARAYLAFYLSYGAKKNPALGDEAQRVMKDALALAPGDGYLLAWHGQVLDILGKKKEALAAWKKALELEPRADLAWNGLQAWAVNPQSSTPVKEREAWIEFLGGVRPNDAIFWNNVGLLYRDAIKDYRKSLDAYLKASTLAPEDQGIVNDTGLIYQYHGKSIKEDPSQCIPYYEKVIDLVEYQGQSPLMGYRDTLENLAVYYGPPGNPAAHDPNPELALQYAVKRNDPDMLSRLPQGLGQVSMRASGVKMWAEKKLGE